MGSRASTQRRGAARRADVPRTPRFPPFCAHPPTALLFPLGQRGVPSACPILAVVGISPPLASFVWSSSHRCSSVLVACSHWAAPSRRGPPLHPAHAEPPVPTVVRIG